MKYTPTLFVAFLMLCATTAIAQIDFSTGVTGYTTGVAQSFNENRAIDFTVISHVPVHITSISIHGYNTGNDGVATLGARIYLTSTHVQVAGHDTTVGAQYGGTVTMPIDYILDTGVTYRVSILSGGPNSDNSGFMFAPSTFPYVENQNLLRINHSWDGYNDTFPNITNIYVPKITMTYDTLSITTGITAAVANSNVSLFPNPSNGNFSFNYAGIQPMSKFEVTNMSGQNIESFLLENSMGNKEIILTNLDNGIYFYKIITSETKMIKGKLVIIH